ncbi:hypothetical protein [Haloarcula onubensis]|uniref:Tat pathway signal protein n=1 Tax=Haloarcula onubensis TaxID=2950539 RepID=A0ABU2FR80_9EURY|nr:hypothetical protein [Halomicroarcula sp. S3CR25-11]MDS0283274.1 hypothetical protein [Halomicroarcula sp. S3CR25-11]
MGHKHDEARTTDELSSNTRLPLDRRTALRGAGAGLAALGLGSFTANVAAKPGNGNGGGNDKDGGSVGTSAANQFRFAGERWHILSASSDAGQNTSPVETLMRIDGVKQSNSWQDSLVFQPSLETSLLTDVSVSGGSGSSTAVAGVLGWIEMRDTGAGEDAWQMVTVNDDLVEPPTASNITDEGGLDASSPGRVRELARGIVAVNTRNLGLEWDLEALVEAALDEVVTVLAAIEAEYPDFADYQATLNDFASYGDHEDWLVTLGVDRTTAEKYSARATDVIGSWSAYADFVGTVATSYDDVKAALLELDIFSAIYLQTKSANSFNFVKTGAGGTHDVRLRGALHVFVDPDDDADVTAKAIVGNRTMLVEPTKIKARVSGRDED